MSTATVPEATQRRSDQAINQAHQAGCLEGHRDALGLQAQVEAAWWFIDSFPRSTVEQKLAHRELPPATPASTRRSTAWAAGQIANGVARSSDPLGDS